MPTRLWWSLKNTPLVKQLSDQYVSFIQLCRKILRFFHRFQYLVRFQTISSRLFSKFIDTWGLIRVSYLKCCTPAQKILIVRRLHWTTVFESFTSHIPFLFVTICGFETYLSWSVPLLTFLQPTIAFWRTSLKLFSPLDLTVTIDEFYRARVFIQLQAREVSV